MQEINAEDLILAGGQKERSGNVTDDVIAAVYHVCPFGGLWYVSGTTQIGDDARLARRDIIIDDWIGSDLYATAQQFKTSGEIIANRWHRGQSWSILGGLSVI